MLVGCASSIYSKRRGFVFRYIAREIHFFVGALENILTKKKERNEVEKHHKLTEGRGIGRMCSSLTDERRGLNQASPPAVLVVAQ
jgi:hypothetical protein